ncbi:hypothetical protein [Arthrobacter sp. JCM 19049]|uniref:hypothetical protein n=1 Tax=Arthrobacter sp. JCM 19049 TaxID=1460643 RepID=UPI0024372E53|nr:hypothetical protein [Arthrobacter sp. JCM 19049]
MAGVLLAWLQIDGRGGPQATGRERAGALSRLVVGLLLVIGGLLLIVNGTVSTSDLIGGIWRRWRSSAGRWWCCCPLAPDCGVTTWPNAVPDRPRHSAPNSPHTCTTRCCRPWP